MLRAADGTEFCTGWMEYTCRPVYQDAQDTKLFLPISVFGFPADAVVDTGGAYLILDPSIALLAGLGIHSRLEMRRINIRGEIWRGFLHRVTVEFEASHGDSLEAEMTVFIPDPVPGQVWTLPCFLGWQGSLERIRFAIDPVKELFYFGDAG